MPRIIVVGAGLAGLTAALRLQEAGLEVRVLELAPQVGGRVSSIRKHGVILDPGCQFIGPPQPYTHTFQFLDSAGLRNELQPASRTAALVRAGKVHSYRYGSIADFFKLPALSLSAKLGLVKAAPELSRLSSILDFHAPERAYSIDDQDVSEYGVRLVGREATERLVEPLMSALYYYPPQGVSRAFLMSVISGLGDAHTFCLKGGNDRLPRSMAAGLDVRTGVQVRRAAPHPEGGAVVEWEGPEGTGNDRCETVVMAAPAPVAAALCEGLTAAEQDYLTSVRYTAVVAVAFGEKQPFGGETYGAAIAAAESPLLSAVTFEHNKGQDRVPKGQGAAIAFLNAASSAALINAPDPEIIDRVSAEMERFWPGHTASVSWTHVIRHPLGTPLFEVGSIRRLKNFLERPDPGPMIHFCGDYLSGPHIEGAITSGLRAAHSVLAAIGKERE